jgi:hypothetical protein
MGMRFSFGFHGAFGFLGDGLKGAQGLGPHLVEVGAKAGDSFRVELVKTTGAGTRVGHKAGLFENFQVLRDGGTRYGKSTGQLVNGERTTGELLEDRHAGGIAEGVESGL